MVPNHRKETPKSLYGFPRPFVNEPTTIYSFVPPASLSHNRHSTAPNPHPQPRHHQKLFTTASSKSYFSSPPCSSRVGVGLQAGADSNLPRLNHSQQSPQPYLTDCQTQQQQRQEQQHRGGGERRTSESFSVFLPMLSMLAASASSVASQQQQQEDLGKERGKGGSGSPNGNGVQCDDLPSPDYLNLCNSNNHTAILTNASNKASLGAPYTILPSSSLPPRDLPTSASDMPIPR
ncbi:hypothetical protein BG015_004533, partial [Linnemannia schmuckeri]